MRRSLVFCLLLPLCQASLAGTPAATLQTSPACRQALEALTRAEDDGASATAASAPAAERLRNARRAAAQACLGTADTPLPQTRQPAPAPAPAPSLSPSPTRPPLTLPSVTTTPPAPAPQNRPLVTVTRCDATGCWASDGSRLQRQGGLLLGPRGACTQLGAVLNCP